ncbi:NADP-dependent oxidoreductase [Flavihumibacter fluvii]|uniref:NADP-dependent oxidoreductase n=1 Tax=Flavihumibacter fluvii TaxID=2838157 RepID=UPI001BDF0881|nr:NADP-dependent oxidoreductase [Flavihumibacter fluvii]ULQ51333.1 NADP-dependent oxidoreductase [Flavihumibacter fluvii]
MKAVILKDFGSVDNFETADVSQPVMQDNEVLVKIRATAFNPIDYQMRRGDGEKKLLNSGILGREFSGKVAAVGKAVRGFAPGDDVAAYVGSLGSNGTYAQYISVPQQMLAKKPTGLLFAQAAALPLVGLTALQCVERLQLTSEDRVFVSGAAGGVGTILLQLLLHAGIQQITATAGSTESKAHLRSLGLQENQVIDYRQNDLAECVMMAASGKEYDCCIDLVGGTMAELCAAILKVQGTYVDVTYLATEAARSLLFDKATVILNVANYANALCGKPAQLAVYGEKLRALFQRVEANLIKPPLVEIVGNLSDETVKRGHQLLEANGAKGKKLVMLVE